MESELSLAEIKKEWHGSMKAYLVGFVVCLLLTGVSFSFVLTEAFSGLMLLYTIVGLALIQALVQVLCFLHLGQEAKPRWETLIFCFMLLVLLIIAIGSLWIMNDLNDRMMVGM